MRNKAEMCDKTIVGIDILPGQSPLSKSPPKYAFALMKNGSLVEVQDKISLAKLLKLINKLKPDIVATDNILEVLPSKRKLTSFLSKLPPKTSFVQVTGSPTHGMQPLNVIATKYGIPISGKATPLDTARTAAKLAGKSVGYVVSAFENETQITVSRARSLGSGGWSQARWRRRLHALVLAATKEIKEKLENEELDFDFVKRESDFGLDQSRFIVQAKKERILRVIKSQKGPDIYVRVSPTKKENLEFFPLSVQEASPIPRRNLIVGVDPGTTTGIAMLDFNGNVLTLRSTKIFSRSKIIRMISHFGTATVIATDVVPAPDFVQKLANVLKARLYLPSRVLSVAEKQEIVQQYAKEKNLKVANSHQRDALASAIKALSRFRNMFEKIRAHIKETGVNLSFDEVGAKVIRQGLPIKAAIAQMISKIDKQESPTIVPEKKKDIYDATLERFTKRMALMRGKIKSLTKLNEQLMEENRQLKEQISRLNEQIEARRSKESLELRKMREFTIRDSEIKTLKSGIQQLENRITELQTQLSNLRNMKILETRGDAIPLKVIESFAQKSICEVDETFGIKRGDIVLFVDASGGGSSTAELLIEKSLKAIMVMTPMSHLAKEKLLEVGIPVISATDSDIRRVGEFAVVEKRKFEKLISESQKELEERRYEKTAEAFHQMIREYKHRKED
ncbi:MAG: DUF460 domain-containing protein [Promethearchaeota archaeon]